LTSGVNDERLVEQIQWRDLGVDVGCLLAPAAAALAGGGTKILGAALVFSALILPGVLGTRLLLRPGHPWLEFPARLGVSAAISFALFGTVSALAAKLHWGFSGFLYVLVVTYVTGCAALLVLLIRRRRVSGRDVESWEPWPGPFAVGPGVALTLVICAILTLFAVGGARGNAWPWFTVGLASGVAALAVFAFAKREEIEVRPSVETAGGFASVLTAVLWIAVALLTWYLMTAAFERKKIGMDDTTHVSRCVDFLGGEPLDRYEPSLGHEIPMDPAYLLPTTSMLAATMARSTGLSCAAQQRTVLPPMLLLIGLGSWVALLAVLLRGNRLLLPLATLILLGILATSIDGMRSEAHAMFYRTMQPKSFHLAVLAPLQWGSLLLMLRRPSTRHTVLACLLVVSGHLVTPWATVAGLVWTAACLATSWVWQRRAVVGLVVVLALLAGLGGLHALQARHGQSGTAASAARTPGTPLELATVNGEHVNRLDAGGTIGRYGLFRLGILAIPWVLLLGLRCREMSALALASIAALCLAFVGPLADLQAELLPRSILWRTRWILPSAVNGTLLAIALFESVRALAWRLKGGALAPLVAVGVTLGACTWTGAGGGSERVERDGQVARWSKLDDATHELVEILEAVDPTAYLLAQPRLPAYVCQLLPDVRLILSRRLIIEWFFGVEEATRRKKLIDSFYTGTMTPEEFLSLRAEFPVEWAVIDRDQEAATRSRALLQESGWTEHGLARHYELWRAP
jgi:hypothetical protein